MAFLAEKDKDAKPLVDDQVAEELDRGSPLRADILGSIAGADPNSPGYLGKINHLITAHGAVDKLNPDPDFSGMTSDNERAPSMRLSPPMGTPSSLMTPAPTPPAPPPPTPTTMASLNTPRRGFLGKIGHGLARMGNIAGDILAPGIMEAIPGTDLHKRFDAAITDRNAARDRELAVRETTAGADKSRADTEAQKEAFTESQAGQPKPKEEEWTESKDYTGPNGEPVEIEKNSGLMRLAGSGIGLKRVEKPEAEKTPPHITAMKGGQPHIMERDPKTGEYSIDRGLAPPSFAAAVLPTKTTELLGPDGVMHRYQWNESTGKYDLDMGAAPTGAAAHSIFQAGRIEDVGPKLIADIQANKAMLGNLESYYKEWTSGTPVSDPKAAELLSELMSFAALQPALHGFKAANAMEAFEKLVGGLAKNPDATIASINGILKTASAFNVGPKTGGPKAGDVENGYKFKGGDPKDQKNWEKVKKSGGR